MRKKTIPKVKLDAGGDKIIHCPKCDVWNTVEGHAVFPSGRVSVYCKKCVNTYNRIRLKKKSKSHRDIRAKKLRLGRNGMKECTRCHEAKPLSDYMNQKHGYLGKGQKCRECISKITMLCHKEARDRALRRNYGITLDDYNYMLESQGGKCAICGQLPENIQYEKLHVDHDHATGAVRGLLCDMCNKGIGSLKDDVRLLDSARRYLVMHNLKDRHLTTTLTRM